MSAAPLPPEGMSQEEFDAGVAAIKAMAEAMQADYEARRVNQRAARGC